MAASSFFLKYLKPLTVLIFAAGFLKRLGDSSSGFSLSQFVLFLHLQTDR